MNQNASCKGQKFGHDFPYTGADCRKCGISQDVLSGKIKSVSSSIQSTLEKVLKPRKPPRGIHSELHWLVNELRTEFHETAKRGKGSFGFYLKLLQRIGFQAAFTLWREVKADNCNNPGRLFWWKYKNLIQTKKDGSSSQQKRNDNV